MCKIKPGNAIFLFLLLLPLVAAPSVSAQAISAQEIMARAQQVQFYAGNDMKAKIRMRLLSKEGQQRIREMVMLRRNLPQAGEQRFFIYFSSPADVRDMTFMVWKHPQRDDERWIFLPALNLVRRIAANDKRSSFVGSDFSYEDVSGRAVAEETHAVVREDTLNGRPVIVIWS